MTDQRREEHEREVVRADEPKRLSAAEFNQIAREQGIEVARKVQCERMGAWIDSLAKRDERIAVRAKEKGAPTCEKCGAVMTLRHSKTGSKFWGCSKYPRCSFTMNYQPKNRRG